VSSVKQGIARRFVDIGIYEVNNPLPAVIDGLNAFQPDYLSGYTNALKILAGKQREGVLRLSLSGVGASGEAVTDADRAILGQAFGCGVTIGYACSEHLQMGVAPPGSSRIVLYDDELIYEFYDDHSVITNLFNYTLPLIRYRMSDVLRPAEAGEHAPYLAIESLIGRSTLQPTFKNQDGIEDFISQFTIIGIFIAGVTRFQMHLVSDTEFRFMVCLDTILSTEQKAACVAAAGRRLREILDRKLMSNVKFEVVETDELPVNPRTRKFQLIVDARPPRL
jgi:phenylacetate-CoA ligase